MVGWIKVLKQFIELLFKWFPFTLQSINQVRIETSVFSNIALVYIGLRFLMFLLNLVLQNFAIWDELLQKAVDIELFVHVLHLCTNFDNFLNKAISCLLKQWSTAGINFLPLIHRGNNCNEKRSRDDSERNRNFRCLLNLFQANKFKWFIIEPTEANYEILLAMTHSTADSKRLHSNWRFIDKRVHGGFILLNQQKKCLKTLTEKKSDNKETILRRFEVITEELMIWHWF